MSQPQRDTWTGAILPMSDGPAYCQSFPLPLCFFLWPSFLIVLSYIWLILPPRAALSLLLCSFRAQGTKPLPAQADKQEAPVAGPLAPTGSAVSSRCPHHSPAGLTFSSPAGCISDNILRGSSRSPLTQSLTYLKNVQWVPGAKDVP